MTPIVNACSAVNVSYRLPWTCTAPILGNLNLASLTGEIRVIVWILNKAEKEAFLFLHRPPFMGASSIVDSLDRTEQ